MESTKRTERVIVGKSPWTLSNTVKSPYGEVEIPNRLVFEHVWKNMAKWADKTAIMCGLTKRSFTYNELYKSTRNFASKLRKQLNITDGDVIFIMILNSPDYALVMLGALQAGGVVTTANPIYTAHEVKNQLVLSKPKLLIGMPETIPILKGALKLAQLDLPIIACKGYTNENHLINTISLEELTNDDNVDYGVLNKVSRTLDDVALLPYSSGTTGLPKGVELTHRNIVANCLQQDIKGMMHYDETTDSHQDTILGILPFYHIYGMMLSLFHKLSVGVQVVTLPKFTPTTFLNALKEHKISLLNAAPPIVSFLGSHPDVTPEHLSHLKLVVCGAAPVPKININRFLDRAKNKVDFIHAYGLTETSPLVSITVRGFKNYTSAGLPIASTELKIVDADLHSLGPNEVGELLIRGPQVMKGYRDNTEATKNTLTEDGWLKTGDLAFIDKDGAVTISDRIKELIKVKGYQVAPAELEGVLREHPDVEDAGVIGIPDPRTGEAPKAFIVTKNVNIEHKNIINFVAERVAEYKRIREIVVIDALPRNPSGKILRRALKEKYCC